MALIPGRLNPSVYLTVPCHIKAQTSMSSEAQVGRGHILTAWADDRWIWIVQRASLWAGASLPPSGPHLDWEQILSAPLT